MEISPLHATRYKLLAVGTTKSDKLLTEFQKFIHAGIYDWDLINNIIYCSEELLALFGKSFGAGNGTIDLEEVIHNEDKNIFNNSFNKSRKSKAPLSVEFRVIWPDKTERFLCLKGETSTNEIGEVVRMIGTVFDITERKWDEEELQNKNIAVLNAYKRLEASQAELKKLNNELEKRVEDRTLALKKNESELKTLFETIPHLVWRADSKGNLNYFNKQWFDYTGLTYEESISEWTSILHPDDKKIVLENWRESIETGQEFNFECKIKRFDNTYHWFLIKALPITDGSGEVIKWFGTSTDIHDQKLLNEKKDEFISIASHELKTPLTSIKAYIQLLTRTSSFHEDKVAQSYLQRTEAFINKLNVLIADLLDVSKIQAGKLQFNMSVFDFDSLVKESIDTMQNITPSHKIEVIKNNPVKVFGDRQRLEQVFFNFISNAIKYSPNSTKIVVDVNEKDGMVEVAITDFGIGIPKENLEKIFDRFYRAEGLSPTFAGLGIGLFIASEIIKRHNGNFYVKSEVGKGSTFYFSLPLAC